MERRIQKVISLFAICFLVSCATVEETGPTEMQGEPVNISLKGQKEMCEREPESMTLCTTNASVWSIVEYPINGLWITGVPPNRARRSRVDMK